MFWTIFIILTGVGLVWAIYQTIENGKQQEAEIRARAEKVWRLGSKILFLEKGVLYLRAPDGRTQWSVASIGAINYRHNNALTGYLDIYTGGTLAKTIEFTAAIGDNSQVNDLIATIEKARNAAS